MSALNNNNNKIHSAVITAWGRWHNKMHFKRNIGKWFFSYAQRNVTTSINQNPDSLARDLLCNWLKHPVLWAPCPAAKELLAVIMLLPPILLIKPVILHSETLDMDSSLNWEGLGGLPVSHGDLASCPQAQCLCNLYGMTPTVMFSEDLRLVRN